MTEATGPCLTGSPPANARWPPRPRALHVEGNFTAESRSRRGHRRGHHAQLVTGWLSWSTAYKLRPLAPNNTPTHTQRHNKQQLAII